MTGQKDRYSTTEKLWDLDDKQLSTPKHDELVLMLLNKKYCFEKLEIDGESVEYDIDSEVPILNDNKFIIGYWDVVVGRRYSCGFMGDFFVECKPSIESFGQTLRQINTYKAHLHPNLRNNVFLFTPDVRFKSAFESQNIQVISP